MTGTVVCLPPQAYPYPDSSPRPTPHELKYHRGALLHWLNR